MTFRTIAAALFLGLTATVAHAEGTLTIGTEGAYPPFNFIDSAGNISGFDVEIGQALCAKMEVTCNVVAQDWDGIIPGLLAKKYDFIIASMFITEERKQQVNFTDPYYLAAMTVVAPKDTAITDYTADGLDGKVVGVQGGTTQAEYAHKVFTKSEIREYPTQDEVNLDLASGRIDLSVDCSLDVYDILPLEPIIRGAGGLVTDWEGRGIHLEWRGRVLAGGDPALHARALEILRG